MAYLESGRRFMQDISHVPHTGACGTLACGSRISIMALTADVFTIQTKGLNVDNFQRIVLHLDLNEITIQYHCLLLHNQPCVS